MSNTVSRAPRRNRQFWIDHVKRWRNTKETSEKFQEANVGNFIVRHDPDTGRIFVGHAKSKEVRTFYMDDGRSADPFQAAIALATELSTQG